MSEVRSDVGRTPCRRGEPAATPALAGPYQPFVLTGHRSGLPPAIEPDLAVYRLWFVRAGVHRVATRVGRFRVTAGRGLLLQPGGRVEIDAESRSSWMRIDFDVWCRPRGFGPGQAAAIPAGAPCQPLPSEVWGCGLPWEIPPALAEDCREAMERMTDRWWRSSLDHLDANAMLAAFLVRLLRHVAGREPVASAPVDAAETWAREHLSERPTVAAMAAAVGLNRAYFTELYSARRGRPPLAFLDDLRMARAMDLLARGESTIALVASLAGYGSPVAFSRRFRLRHGLAPSAWRSRRRSGGDA